VAMGVVAGAAFAGLPGNPVAAFVTFVRVVRPLLPWRTTYLGPSAREGANGAEYARLETPSV